MLTMHLLCVILLLLGQNTAASVSSSRRLPKLATSSSRPRSSSLTVPPLNATWQINANSPIHQLSPDLYGVFWEEIGYSGQGGLHQQQIRNGNFETFSADYDPWETLPAQSSDGSDVQYIVSLIQDQPINAYNPTSMQVTTQWTSSEASVAVVSIANSGYWGINLQNRPVFQVSMFARSPSIKSLTARLVTMNGSLIHAEATVSVSSNWMKLSANLTVNKSSVNVTDASFVLSWNATNGDSLFLDVISLLPSTGYSADTPFLRPDLAQMVADMKPSFLRVPGGCFVEGGRLNNRFNWKRALGPIENRRGVLNDVWGYYSETHIGIFELFQWAETLVDAYGQPTRTVWVINAGVSHTDSIPTSHINGWVQDALDSVDFIRGDASSNVWAQQRAAMGRAAPFRSLKYVAIGNEDCGKPYYESNYQVFYDAFRLAHPDLIIIGNCPPDQINVPQPLWDYHTYPDYQVFLDSQQQWDNYTRSSSLIFISEYATHGGQGKGNQRAALAEAAWMLGFERNADLVKMAAYAPLMTNVEGRPDNIQQALLFNHHQVYGTPSYWVQTMFSRALLGAVPGSVYNLMEDLQRNQLTDVSVNSLVARINATHSAVILKVVNWADREATFLIELSLPAGANVLPQMDVSELIADSLLSENSFASPSAVTAKSSTSTDGAADLLWMFPAYSLTVLRLYFQPKSAMLDN